MGVTVLEAGPNLWSCRRRPPRRRATAAVQLGFGERRRVTMTSTRAPRPLREGRRRFPPRRYLAESRLDAVELGSFEKGQEIGRRPLLRRASAWTCSAPRRARARGRDEAPQLPDARWTHGAHEFFRHGGSIGCRHAPRPRHPGQAHGGQTATARHHAEPRGRARGRGAPQPAVRARRGAGRPTRRRPRRCARAARVPVLITGYERKDSFYRRAKREGLPSRAAYKLEEIQAAHGCLRTGDRVLDLGCWPGGWLDLAGRIVVLGRPRRRRRPRRARAAAGVCERDRVGRRSRATRCSQSGSRRARAARPTCCSRDAAPKLTGVRATDRAHEEALLAAIEAALAELLRPGGALVLQAHGRSGGAGGRAAPARAVRERALAAARTRAARARPSAICDRDRASRRPRRRAE